MRLKKLAAVMAGVVLLFGSVPISPLAKDDEEENDESGDYSTKDEAIYGNLGGDGELEDMYVVNTFHDTNPGEIVDHGDYSDVRNLTNLTDIEQDDGDVRFEAEKGDDDFNYQGFLENQPLPWDIDITYKLDDEEVDPDDLAGKDGSLEIQIETSANDDVDKTFFENYMLQISLPLDPDSFEDIQAPDGTKAKEGEDTNVTFTGMPDEDETFIVSAEVSDLEMDPIDISATPASMPIDDPDLGDMKSDMRSLSDAVKDINGGVGDLKGGISDLNDGASELNDGSSDYLNGINELDQSSGELVDGSSQINDVFQQVDGAMEDVPDETPDMSDLDELPESIHDLADDLDDTADGIDELHDNYNSAYDSLDDAIDDLADEDISDDQIAHLLDSIEDDDNKETVKSLKEAYEKAQKVKETYEESKDAFEAVTGTLDDTSGSIRDMADEADDFADEIENGLDKVDDLDQLDELTSGISDLASQYQSFHQGLVEYTDGVSDLASNYEEIDDGIGEFVDGTADLEDGAGDLQDGTSKLEDETSDMPDDVQSEVDDMMDEFDDSDFEPTSFVSDKNEDIDVVQFALQTESIEVEDDNTDDDDDDEEEKGLWERFLDLFR